MKALLSARSHCAVLPNGTVLQMDDYQAAAIASTAFSPAELKYFLNDASDIRVVEAATLEEIEDLLRAAIASVNALDLTLFVCDPQLSLNTHVSAFKDLEYLLANPAVCEYVTTIIYGVVPIECGHLARMVQLASEIDCCRAAKLIGTYGCHSDCVADVVRAWDVAKPEYDECEESVAQIVSEGWFERFAVALKQGKDLDEFQAVKGKPPVTESIIRKWIRSVYWTHAVRLFDDGVEEQPLRSKGIAIGTLSGNLPTESDSRDDWIQAWRDIVTVEFVELCSDLVATHSAEETAPDLQEKVLETVLVAFPMHGLYAFQSELLTSEDLANIVCSVACDVLNDLVDKEPDDQELEAAARTAFGKNRTRIPPLAQWMNCVATYLRNTVILGSLHPAFATLCSRAIGKPIAVMEELWAEFRRRSIATEKHGGNMNQVGNSATAE